MAKKNLSKQKKMDTRVNFTPTGKATGNAVDYAIKR